MFAASKARNGHLAANELRAALAKAGMSARPGITSPGSSRRSSSTRANVRTHTLLGQPPRHRIAPVNGRRVHQLPHLIAALELNQLSRIPRLFALNAPDGLDIGDISVLPDAKIPR